MDIPFILYLLKNLKGVMEVVVLKDRTVVIEKSIFRPAWCVCVCVCVCGGSISPQLHSVCDPHPNTQSKSSMSFIII